jgi:hypothetical protein
MMQIAIMQLSHGPRTFLAIVGILAAAIAVVVLDQAIPGLVGVAPILGVPDWVLSAAQAVAILLILLVCFVFVVAATGRLMPPRDNPREPGMMEHLEDYLSRFDVDPPLAPNLDATERRTAIETLRQIAGDPSSLVVCVVDEDGTSDHVFIATRAKAAAVRRWAERMLADDVLKMGKTEWRRLKAQFPEAGPSGWRIGWD